MDAEAVQAQRGALQAELHDRVLRRGVGPGERLVQRHVQRRQAATREVGAKRARRGLVRREGDGRGAVQRDALRQRPGGGVRGEAERGRGEGHGEAADAGGALRADAGQLAREQPVWVDGELERGGRLALAVRAPEGLSQLGAGLERDRGGVEREAVRGRAGGEVAGQGFKHKPRAAGEVHGAVLERGVGHVQREGAVGEVRTDRGEIGLADAGGERGGVWETEAAGEGEAPGVGRGRVVAVPVEGERERREPHAREVQPKAAQAEVRESDLRVVHVQVREREPAGREVDRDPGQGQVQRRHADGAVEGEVEVPAAAGRVAQRGQGDARQGQLGHAEVQAPARAARRLHVRDRRARGVERHLHRGVAPSALRGDGHGAKGLEVGREAGLTEVGGERAHDGLDGEAEREVPVAEGDREGVVAEDLPGEGAAAERERGHVADGGRVEEPEAAVKVEAPIWERRGGARDAEFGGVAAEDDDARGVLGDERPRDAIAGEAHGASGVDGLAREAEARIAHGEPVADGPRELARVHHVGEVRPGGLAERGGEGAAEAAIEQRGELVRDALDLEVRDRHGHADDVARGQRQFQVHGPVVGRAEGGGREREALVEDGVAEVHEAGEAGHEVQHVEVGDDAAARERGVEEERLGHAQAVLGKGREVVLVSGGHLPGVELAGHERLREHVARVGDGRRGGRVGEVRDGRARDRRLRPRPVALEGVQRGLERPDGHDAELVHHVRAGRGGHGRPREDGAVQDGRRGLWRGDGDGRLGVADGEHGGAGDRGDELRGVGRDGLGGEAVEAFGEGAGLPEHVAIGAGGTGEDLVQTHAERDRRPGDGERRRAGRDLERLALGVRQGPAVHAKREAEADLQGLGGGGGVEDLERVPPRLHVAGELAEERGRERRRDAEDLRLHGSLRGGLWREGGERGEEDDHRHP